MTTQRKPKSVTIPQSEYSALLGVVAAHRADAGQTPSKVLEHYDSVTRNTPRGISKMEIAAPAPHEVDRGGRVFYVEGGKIWEGRKESGGVLCGGCKYTGRNSDWRACAKAEFACNGTKNVRYGHRTLHPVQAVG